MKYIFIIFVLFFWGCESPSSTGNKNILLFLPLVLNSQTTVNAQITIPEDFADTVVYAPNDNGTGFRDKNNAINGVRGAGCCSGSTDVFTLSKTGDGAQIVFEWKNNKILNGLGIDFVVFENPFRVGSENSSTFFMEQLIAEVSIDGIKYCGFSPQYLAQDINKYSNIPEKWKGFAGMTPVLYNIETNPLTGDKIYDKSLAGGDGFDLQDLTSDNSFGIGCSEDISNKIKNEGFVYLRLVSATSRLIPGTSNYFPSDIASFDGPDIDGVAARYRIKR